jgi:hypothetical protein
MNDDHAPPVDFELLKLVAQHLAENAAHCLMGNSATAEVRSAAAGSSRGITGAGHSQFKRLAERHFD